MKLANQALCKQCGQPMRTVAEIAPFAGGPGLIAFVCADCGATDSTLIYPATARRLDHQQHAQQRAQPSSSESCPAAMATGIGT